MRRNYKRKKFHVSGICIFLVLIIFSVAFVLWAMKPDNFRNEKNKINLHLSEEAQNDLFEIKSYNEEELLNPSAALATVSRITKSLRILQNYAQTGAPLASIANIESDYRFIISDNYISFYRAYGSEVYIDRILYACRDYMRILFGDSTTDK